MRRGYLDADVAGYNSSNLLWRRRTCPGPGYRIGCQTVPTAYLVPTLTLSQTGSVPTQKQTWDPGTCRFVTNLFAPISL